MRPWSLVVGLSLALSGSARAGDGIERLFNGKDLTGWEHVGAGGFVVADGQLETVGGMGHLWYTAKKLKDVALKVVYKTEKETTNSGVFIRLPEPPMDPARLASDGYEVQIDDSGADDRVTGTLVTLTTAKARPGKPGEWNQMVITLDGDRTIVEVNGQVVTDYTEGDPVLPRQSETDPARGHRPTEGYIALQNRGEGHTVLFKEVSITPLR